MAKPSNVVPITSRPRLARGDIAEIVRARFAENVGKTVTIIRRESAGDLPGDWFKWNESRIDRREGVGAPGANGEPRMIELLEDVGRPCTNGIVLQAHADFRPSIRPIYGVCTNSHRIKHVGSCVLLEVDGTPIVSTAAHLIDDLKITELLIAGLVGTELVRIQGGRIKTTPGRGGIRRQFDPFDCAFWQPPEATIAALGPVKFLDASRISHNRAPIENRLYTAIGYPISRNKDRVDHAAEELSIGVSMYTSSMEPMPKLAALRGVSGNEHFFMRFEKHAFTADGTHMNAFGPDGLSGGALLDLGDFSSPEVYAKGIRRKALLSGMLIEHNKQHHALIAVKIGPIINGIRLALARRVEVRT
jgi:hypothetical protein